MQRRQFVVGYGENGITGPTTPAGPSPVCGGAMWPHEIVTLGYETVAIFPAWDVGGFGCSQPDISPAKECAHKFAAVDDLLAVCKDIREFLKRSGYDTTLVNAAIAKAEGRS